jgi:hypothetical protein
MEHGMTNNPADKHMIATPELFEAQANWIAQVLKRNGAVSAMRASLSINDFMKSCGAPNTNLRKAFLEMLAQADLAFAAGLASYKSAETYREAMLKD